MTNILIYALGAFIRRLYNDMILVMGESECKHHLSSCSISIILVKHDCYSTCIFVHIINIRNNDWLLKLQKSTLSRFLPKLVKSIWFQTVDSQSTVWNHMDHIESTLSHFRIKIAANATSGLLLNSGSSHHMLSASEIKLTFCQLFFVTYFQFQFPIFVCFYSMADRLNMNWNNVRFFAS